MQDKAKCDEIQIGWVIVRICILVMLIVLFNFFPGRIGVLVSAVDWHSFVPLLAPEFGYNMPWLNVWWGLALVLEVTHLCLRRWQPLTRWADLALSVLAGLILLQVLLQGAILVRADTAAVAWNQLLTLPLPTEQGGIALLDLLIRGGLALAILAIAIDSLRKLRLCMADQQKLLPVSGK
jgi:hypothetical protein